MKTLTALGVLALLTYPADFMASAFGAKRFGASPRAVTGAIMARWSEFSSACPAF